MARYISVLSAKGGTGKSTVAAHLALSLAKTGSKVLDVDLDIGLKTQDTLLSLAESVVYNFGDILDGKVHAEDAVVTHGTYSSLSLLSAPDDISEAFSLKALVELLRGYMDDYEYIILDMPAGLGVGLLLTKELADLALIVTTPDSIAIRSTKKLGDIVAGTCRKPSRLIVNKVSAGALSLNQIATIDDIIDSTSIQLIAVLPVEESINIDTPATSKKPKEKLTDEIFDALAQRVKGEPVPIILKQLKV